MNASQLAARLRATNTEFERLIMQLSIAQMNIPGAVGVWSVKDVLAHIAFWQSYIAKVVQAAKRGEEPQLYADDETEHFNASATKQYYLTPLGGVLARLHTAREDLLEAIADLTDEQLNQVDYFPWNNGRTLLDRIAGSSFRHDQEHIEQIRQWMRDVLKIEN